MSLHYYKAFFDAKGITMGKPSATCSLGDSISQFLLILISTRKGEMPGDPDFGCAIWDLQFEIVVDSRKWQNEVETSILEGVMRYEKRLEHVAVELVLEDVEVTYPFKQYPEIKKQATIQIRARLKHSQENFSFVTKIYVSPLAN